MVDSVPDCLKMTFLILINFLTGLIATYAADSSTMPTLSTTYLKDEPYSGNKSDDPDPYPCPKLCRCDVSVDSDRAVACMPSVIDIDTPSNSIDFGVFNNTNTPSRLFIYCKAPILSSKLDDDMFESLHAFSFLKIKNCRIKTVSRYAFRGMKSLKQLIIDGGHTKVIKGDAQTQFDNRCFQLPELKSLEVVSLVHTGTSLPPSLCNLDKLWFVNLSRNSIEAFSNTGLICDNSTNVEAIDISGNALKDLPANFDLVTTKLKRVTASENNIRNISSVLFRNLTEINIVELSNNNITAFPEDFLGNNRNLWTLQLANNFVQNLPKGIFNQLGNLSFLNLDHMGLHDGVWLDLHNLKNLVALYMSSNNITNFNVSTMSRLVKLVVLDIAMNYIVEIPNGTFDSQNEMFLLNISVNRISSVDRNSFKGLGKLIKLDLKNNNLNQIHDEAFVNLTWLKLLNISYNQIIKLPVFPSNLTYLDLRNNDITHIESMSFARAVNLTGINLSFNKLIYIPRNVFETNLKLQLLQLSFNYLVAFDYRSFPKACSLDVINLRNNRISDITLSFNDEYFPNLKKLDLRENTIELIVNPVVGNVFPTSIEEILLGHNKISFLDNFVFDLPHIRIVDLRQNEISNMSNLVLKISANRLTPVVYYLAGNPFNCDCTLAWLRSVVNRQNHPADIHYIIRDLNGLLCHHVYRQGNAFLKDIPEKDFLCEYVDNCIGRCASACCYRLHCPCRTWCPVQCTCYRSDNWEDADIIDCTDANLTTIPTDVSSAVTTFDLSGNDFHILVPGNFLSLLQLQELILDICNISIVNEGAFKGLENITTLQIGHNHLSNLIPEMFQGLKYLRKLKLDFNKISLIAQKTFDSLKYLNYLDLAGNNLKTISTNEFDIMSNILSLKLSKNPWSCECSYLERMKNFTIAHAHSIIDFSDVVCVRRNATSNITEKHRLADVKLPDICQNETVIYNQTNTESDELGRAAITAMSTTLSLTVLGLMIFGLIFWNREFLKVWCFVKFGWKFNGGENKDEANRPYDAFVSYSNQDEEFVVRELVPYLEEGRQGRQGYRMCVHYRDFAVGASIAESILSAVEQSKRVIIILSDNFLNSEWCQYEFQAAHHQLLEEKKNRIIMILLHDINFDLVDSQLKNYIKTRTYVKYGDPWFWGKLEYAMPKIPATAAENREQVHVEALPAVIPNNVREHEAAFGDGYIDDDMHYLIDNMRNFEADDPKIFAFEVDV